MGCTGHTYSENDHRCQRMGNRTGCKGRNHTRSQANTGCRSQTDRITRSSLFSGRGCLDCSLRQSVHRQSLFFAEEAYRFFPISISTPQSRQLGTVGMVSSASFRFASLTAFLGLFRADCLQSLHCQFFERKWLGGVFVSVSSVEQIRQIFVSDV